MTTNKSLTGVHSIKVAPGIGMGRVGNSDEYFIGPEVPGVVPDPGGMQYKDSAGRIKRQAQRFRVFAYDSTGGLLDEVIEGDTVNGETVSLKWDVHVTNMKAANYAFQGKYAFDPAYLRNSTVQAGMAPSERDQLIIDPKVKTVVGASHRPVELVDPIGSKIFDVPGTTMLSGILNFTNPNNPPVVDGQVEVSYTPAVVSLGNISTDENGRLIFVGGAGKSESCTTPKVVISKTLLPSGVTEVSSNPDKAEIEKNPEYNLNSYFNNPGWYDDTCGGSINATLLAGDTPLFATNDAADQRGWVAVAPPHYAPASNNVVSLLDLQMDLFPESDPYSGPGPFYIAQTNAAGGIDIASLSGAAVKNGTAPVFSSLSLPSGVNVTLQPAVANFQGKNHIAFVASDGTPYIAVEHGGIYTVAVVSATVTSSSAPSLAVLNNKLYYAINSSGAIQLGELSASGATFSQVGDGFAVAQAPALAAFNGALYVAAVSSQNELMIGNNNNAQGSITLSAATVETQSQPATSVLLSASHGISLTVYRGQLVLGFADDGSNAASVASSSDGQAFASTALNDAPALTVNSAVSLTSFNNQLYCAFRSGQAAQLGVSSDGETFTFSTLTSQGQLNPVISANIPVDFYRDIYPILKTVTDYAWTNERAFHGHHPGAPGDFLEAVYLKTLSSPDSAPQSPNATPANPNRPSPNITRSYVFNLIRPPAQQVYLKINGELQKHTVAPPPESAIPVITPAPADPVQIVSGPGVQQRADLMPRLFGNGGSPLENSINGSIFPNQWLPLTDHQLEKFQQWVNGDFLPGDPNVTAYQDIPLPDQLSFAALQPTVGGGFHPGIELTYLMHEESFFSGPFRFTQATLPGSIAAYMSVPWQGDFWSCNVSWWPALRPDIVVERSDDEPPVLSYQQWFRGNVIPPDSDGISNYSGGYDVMVDDWHKLGFVTPVLDEHNQPVKDQGQQVFAETERNQSLNVPSLINSVNNDQTLPTPNTLLTGASATSITVAATQTVSGAEQQAWSLVKSSADAGYFFIQAGSATADPAQVLTVDFSTGGLSLTAKSPYNEDSQLWQYQATQSSAEAKAALEKLVNQTGTGSMLQDSVGYPGHFNLISKVNLKLLTVNTDNSVDTQEAGATSGGTQLKQIWVLGEQIAEQQVGEQKVGKQKLVEPANSASTGASWFRKLLKWLFGDH